MKEKSYVQWVKLSEEKERISPYGFQIKKEYLLPNGKRKTSYISETHDFVVGLALTKEKNVVLAREYRPGPEQIVTDLPSGAINEDENPSEAMLRELQEETGYGGLVEFINTTFVSAYTTQKRHSFIIHDCVKVSEPKTDEDEFIETIVLPFEEFYKEYVITGRTNSMPTLFYSLMKLGKLPIPEL